MQFERPRVRAEGPGGPDVKQGARIACLDCRSAKIRCSAPTDGKVPCRRCERHGKDCVFEKHRRGRKPGRTGAQVKHSGIDSKDIRARNVVEPSFMRAVDGERIYRDQPPFASTSYRHEQHQHYSSPAHSHAHPQQQQHYGNDHHHQQYRDYDAYTRASTTMSPATTTGWSPPLPAERLPPTSAHSPLGGRRSTSRSEEQYVPQEVPNSSSMRYGPPASPRHGEAAHYNHSVSAGSAKDRAAGHSMHSLPSKHGSTPSPVLSLGHQRGHHPHLSLPPLQQQQQQAIHLPSPGSGSASNSTRGWLDFPTPSGNSRSLFSPSNIMPTSSMTTTATTVSQGAGHHSQSPFWPGSAASVTSSSPHHSAKRKLTGDYFSGVVATERSVAPSESNWSDRDAKRARMLEQGKKNDTVNNVQVAREKVNEEDEYEREEYEESNEDEVDQLDEDDVGGGHNDSVLSTPLRLLAHASDAAEAIKDSVRRLSNSGQANKDGANGDGNHKLYIDSNSNGGPSRSLGTGAATMGLVSPPAPRLYASGRELSSMRLPGIGRYGPFDSLSSNPSEVQRVRVFQPPARDQQLLQKSSLPFREPTGRISSMGPPFLPSRNMAVASHVVPAPPTLGTLGRSRSYTTVESLVRAEPLSPKMLEEAPIKSKVTEIERRAEVLGLPPSRKEAVSTSSLTSQSQSAPTFQPESWEYRDGRARAKGSSRILDGDDQVSSRRDSVKSSENDSSSGKSSTVQLASRRGSDSAKKQPTESNDARAPRRWVVTKRRKSTQGLGEYESESEAESEHSEEIGASHREFFSLSLYHSKLDNDADLDPVHQGIVEPKELKKLFDTFFARLNPQLNLLDPFLHSVSFVRQRSALLTTVIAALAARLQDSPRDADLAVSLERYWRENLVPEILMGGYKSVELSQAFLILSLYHKPTNRLADDRSWQYLGFAIRIATEVGVNRRTTCDEGVHDNEQLRRRIRNRSRLWINLFLCDRGLSSQTGRPHTIQEDVFIVGSSSWHTEEYALPEDVCLVSLVKLRRLVGQHCDAFERSLLDHDVDSFLEGSGSRLSKTIISAKERMAGLQYWRMKANADLERWNDTWCLSSVDEGTDTEDMSLRSMNAVLAARSSQLRLCYLHARLHLNSIALQEMEKCQAILAVATSADSSAKVDEGTRGESRSMSRSISESHRAVTQEEDRDLVTPVAHDCWHCALTMIDVLLYEFDEAYLAAAPNQMAIMSTWSALAALRLTKKPERGNAEKRAGSGKRYPWADRKTIVDMSRKLAQVLVKAGRTPEHRNGAAAPYGLYLEGIVSLWEASTPVLPKEDPLLTEEEAAEEGHLPAAALDGDSNVEADTAARKAENHISERTSSDLKADKEASLPLSSPQAKSTSSLNGGDMKVSHSPNSTRHQNKGVDTNSKPHNTEKIDGVISTSSSSNTDKLWDFLSTYPDPSSGFPLSLWQPQPVWSSASSPTTATAAAAAVAKTTAKGRNVPPSSSLNATTASS